MIKIINHQGHAHLFVQGTVSKGLRSAGKRYIDNNGLFINPDEFKGAHRSFEGEIGSRKEVIYQSYRIGKQWNWINKSEIYTDLGPIIDIGPFKVGDEIKHNQFTIVKGIIKLKQ